MIEVPLLDLAGPARARGLGHGHALAGRLRGFLGDSLARLGYLTDRPVDLGSAHAVIAAHRDAVVAALPDLADEVDGLGLGARISRDEAWLLQLRREILGYSRVTAGDCTGYATARGAPVLAQTIDLNGNLDDQIAVLAVSGPRHRSVLVSFAGLLGYLGVNDAGVAVGLNLVLGGTWGRGIPVYLAIRHLLDTAESVEHAVAILNDLTLSSSRAFLLCDADRTVCVETLGAERRVLEGEELFHTNHFLHPDFEARDEMNVFARNSSRRRLESVRAIGIPDADDIAGHHRVLSTAPICVPDNGDIRRERTVAAVILRPDLRELRLWPGDPSAANEHVFSIS
ncbi:C45 family autoproteolytic acyltransferase/hydolase [Nocardia sp. NPDC052566]|uniref:C45 family autoproteolytic acyltransferase/hydolase n=1 Tax=Nocardia sp. NPDC052566 TaxID=3364330 RepID=UPI0037C74258